MSYENTSFWAIIWELKKPSKGCEKRSILSSWSWTKAQKQKENDISMCEDLKIYAEIVSSFKDIEDIIVEDSDPPFSGAFRDAISRLKTLVGDRVNYQGQGWPYDYGYPYYVSLYNFIVEFEQKMGKALTWQEYSVLSYKLKY